MQFGSRTMKKAYILLVAALVIIVLAFTYAKSYLSRLEAEDIRIKEKIERTKLIDSLRTTYAAMTRESNADLQHRYDSLAEESSALIYALESQLDLYLYPEFDPANTMDSVEGDKTTSGVGGTETSVDSSRVISPTEYEVYLAYLEKSLDLPRDLSAYERRVAVREIKDKLMKKFSMSKKELSAVLSKMRGRPSRHSG